MPPSVMTSDDYDDEDERKRKRRGNKDAIVPDGGVVRVAMTLMDQQLREFLDDKYGKGRSGEPRLCDHQPGHLVPAEDDDDANAARELARDAYEQKCRSLDATMRRGSFADTPPPYDLDDARRQAEEAYAEKCAQLDATMRRHSIPDNSPSPPRDLADARRQAQEAYLRKCQLLDATMLRGRR